jgi:HD superfamily phosphodiesterase
VLSRFEDDSKNVELTDQAVLMDIDTPDDFQKAALYLDHLNAPSEDECEAIFLKYKTSVPVIRHGKAVAEISCTIAKLLNETGRILLDIGLIKAGAILHDIARDKPGHAAEGALIINQLGYPDAAKIIAGHMDIEFDADNSVIDETAIVYLADKLIKEDQFISLKKRFSESYEKFSSNPEVTESIMKREKTAILIKEQIEKISGVSDLESVLKAVEIRL